MFEIVLIWRLTYEFFKKIMVMMSESEEEEDKWDVSESAIMTSKRRQVKSIT